MSAGVKFVGWGKMGSVDCQKAVGPEFIGQNSQGQ